MRIGAIFAGGTVNAHYRVLLPLRALERRGHRIVWPRVASLGLDSYDVPRCDAMLLHRCYHPPHLELAARLRERGVAIVWDNDDDFSSLPKIARAEQRSSKREMKAGFARSLQIARMADLVTTPSERIAAIYREGGARTQVIENAVAAAETGRPRPPHRGLVIGYCGAAEHFDDVKKLKIASALEQLLRRHERVRIVTAGVGFADRLPRCEDHGQVTLEELMALERGFDVGIAPLADTPFNRARSNVKLKEYAAAGAMWLASPVGPYAALGQQQGGLLVGDREWADALARVVEDEPLRERLTANARAWARAQTIERLAGRWDAALRDAVEHARSGATAAV